MCHKNKRILLALLFGLLTILLIIFIFSQSVATADISSQASGRFVQFFNSICTFLGLPPFFTQPFVRTCAHFFEFFVLGVLSTLTMIFALPKMKSTKFIAEAFCLMISVIDECIQLFSDGRAFQFSDLIVDAAGASLGIFIVIFVMMLLNKIKDRKIKDGKS